MESVEQQYRRLKQHYPDSSSLLNLERLNNLVKGNPAIFFSKFREDTNPNPSTSTDYLIKALEATATWYVQTARISELKGDKEQNAYALTIASSLEDAVHKLEKANRPESNLSSIALYEARC